MQFPDISKTASHNIRSLMGGMVGEKVREVRTRLTAAVMNGEKMIRQARDTAVEEVRLTDSALRSHPYGAIGIAMGVGALVAWIAFYRMTNSKKNGAPMIITGR